MNRIGFKNFRKFKNFPAIGLSPITIFVGENNAGKSTVVKAILAISDFLRWRRGMENEFYFDNSKKMPKEEIAKERQKLLKNIRFDFNTSYLAHIGTFKRALYNKANEPVITFRTGIAETFIDIEVTGNPNDNESVSGTVTKISVKNEIFNITMNFDLANDVAEVVFREPKTIEKLASKEMPTWYKDSLSKYHSNYKSEVIIKTTISQNWSPIIGDLPDSLVNSLEKSLEATLNPSPEEDERETFGSRFLFPIATGIKGLSPNAMAFLQMFSENVKDPKEHYEDKNNHFDFPWLWRGYIPRMTNIEYLYAHAVTQTVIYSAKDSNDYLSRTIHEFASEKDSSQKREFIIKWMEAFNIGVSYSIRSVGGEAHLVYITNTDGEEVNLADKGMGSIQLMVLLFRLAITLPKKELPKNAKKNSRFGKTIIIEEPEQNLHPMLQSKLADLFYELNTKYGFRFIIETHSEYLVRRSQIIVSNNNYSSQEELDRRNPFKVYYFPSEDVPYDMVYTPSGMFENKFGEGFINEAGKLHMELLRNAQKRNKNV